MDRMRRNLPVFCPTPEVIYFFQKGWTGRNALRGKEKSVFRRTPGIEQNRPQNPGFERQAALVPPWSICYIGAVDPARIPAAG
jgi:hypothetical protein